jgi:hypothetical protein
MRLTARLRPGAFGLPLRGDSSLAASTNSFRRCLGTAITPRMTSLKCRNSGVESKGIAFINLPKWACACRAPVSSYASGTHLCSRLRFADQFIVGQAASDNLFHDTSKPLGIRHLAVIKPKRLFVNVAEQVKRFDRNIGPVDSAFQERPKVFQAVRVDVAVNVGYGVVYGLMNVFPSPIPRRMATHRCRAWHSALHGRVPTLANLFSCGVRSPLP